jgi:hypothetical protein
MLHWVSQLVERLPPVQGRVWQKLASFLYALAAAAIAFGLFQGQGIAIRLLAALFGTTLVGTAFVIDVIGHDLEKRGK